MIKSMTGYGVANLENDAYIIHAEVKTLNSKFLDLSLKYPRQFADKEIEIRNLISERLERGKVNLTLDFSTKSYDNLPIEINEVLFKKYVEKYKSLANQVGETIPDLVKLALQSPSVSTSVTEKSQQPEEWEAAKKVLLEAVDKCMGYREDEGAALLEKFGENIQVIADGLDRIKEEEPRRKQRIKDKIRNHFSEWLEERDFDQNRFEQELIYYFEKLDITEEIVRLETHLNYFRKILLSGESQGKKLGFISQELGREINTIGSKANDVVIQQLVIQMKDELEKIKEQALNIL
ncbi:YicC/YloC family endoribonuclease [Lunatibacter salilacus]|uniref:YicC/YloC family endoribonuclease n=1 Tax=Lunatibacter salilacus TaxID=2483804 RepID=UPI00131C20D6|nr:YicC/YloC family endoribonuclease [Lunatibacter salilacus]